MTLTPLARPGTGLLAQYLTTCPSCRRAAAAHVDTASGRAVLVRFVCPEGCAVDAAAVVAGLFGELPDESISRVEASA